MREGCRVNAECMSRTVLIRTTNGIPRVGTKFMLTGQSQLVTVVLSYGKCKGIDAGSVNCGVEVA